MKRKLDKDEYFSVCRNISNFQFLERAHKETISPNQFFNLIKSLCQKHQISFKKGKWAIGYNFIRVSEGGYIIVKDKFIPTIILTQKGSDIGTLLHEFAHVLSGKRSIKLNKNLKPHGKEFVKFYDKLLTNYYSGFYNDR